MVKRLLFGMLAIAALVGLAIIVITQLATRYLTNAVGSPSDQGGSALVAMVMIGAPIVIITLAGILASRWLFGRVLSGDAGRMTGGVPATGVVKEVRDTGTTINDVNAIFGLTLDVTVPGKPMYEARTQIMLNRTQWGSLKPGMSLPLRVDPTNPEKVAVDLAVAAGATGPIINVPGLEGSRRIEKTRSSDDIIAVGERGEGVILAISDTGKTVSEMAPVGSYTAERAGDPLIYVSMRVEPDTGTVYQSEGLFRAPRERLVDLTIGARVPIAHIPGDPSSATIAWDRF